jgi:ATP-binding cassette, subfamily B (MDR/TAP), member 1
VPFSQLFRFATKTDYILMAVGTICACAMGTALPSFALLWGNMTNSFSDPDKMVDASWGVMFNFIEIGVGAVFAGWGMFGCWMITGERQGIACRKQYLQSLLKQ